MPPRSRHAPPAADAASLDAEEYLDRCGVTAYMKDCVTLLLENRPDEPLTFMGDYFRTVTQPSSPLLQVASGRGRCGDLKVETFCVIEDGLCAE